MTSLVGVCQKIAYNYLSNEKEEEDAIVIFNLSYLKVHPRLIHVVPAMLAAHLECLCQITHSLALFYPELDRVNQLLVTL